MAEAQSLLDACTRCNESFTISLNRLTELRKGIEDTQTYLDVDYPAFNLLIPRPTLVQSLMQGKLTLRLETLTKGYRDSLATLNNQITLFSGKLEGLKGMVKKYWELNAEIQSLEGVLKRTTQEEEKCRRFLSTLRYFEGCGKSLSSAYKLKLHIRRHHNNERKYTCLHCLKRFKSGDSLKRHGQKHANVERGEIPEGQRGIRGRVEIPKLTEMVKRSKDVDLMPLVHVEFFYPYRTDTRLILLPAIQALPRLT